ncbi:rhamnulokinase [Peptoniphilus stercorisuis]|uniref:Rhamnulokinase/L-fuculokinase n=1 Tax=Peptoniphilus stercorisuis TaxID=1436965 RepID=A0ABS4KCR9_9FIRM|nr:rhamnulokinase family protein [Peptoniphilus stercorisuis]MBP2025587.1 rhamnulokinase/L-fuculokinase [Peptoniphilus stercorisuis]
MQTKVEKKVLAIDFGASSGRAMLGIYNGETIKYEEIHRFSNDPVVVNNTMYWDVLRLLHEIKQSLIKSKKYGKIDSLAIDTWGVDFGLINKEGDLIENPIHYRDLRTVEVFNNIEKYISLGELYSITGNQIMNINTLFQLLSLKENKSELLNKTDSILLMPDLLSYFLTNKKYSEVTIASTTQIYNQKEKSWSSELIDKFKIPKNIFKDIVKSGTIVGEISDEVAKELSIDKLKVIAVAGHDTQSALIATPAEDEDFAFLSCGTWSLLGSEENSPIINEKSYKYNITNEVAHENKTSFLKNIIGLWLVQESRRQWIKEGKNLSFSSLEKMAEETEEFKCFIDPDDEIFVSSGNIPQRIKNYCKETKQYIPKTEGEIIRCINESLALKYRKSLEELKDCTNKNYNTIHMIGGGIQSELLCKMTSSACNRKVLAGPVEATVLGNISMQLIALGSIENVQEARHIIKKSEEIKEYLPKDKEKWDKAYERFKEIIKC